MRRSQRHFTLLTALLFGSTGASPCKAAEIGISNFSFAPDGSAATPTQQTEITPLNGGSNVLPATNGTVVYTVTTFTFGAGSNAHLRAYFNATGGQNRLGVEVNDDGLVQFANSNDPGRTSFNLNQDMAGKSVTLLMKQHFSTSHDSLRATNGTGDDTLMNIWVNPNGSDVEGSGLTAGDMHTLWNSNTYRNFTQMIQNQSTPGTAGASSITNTTILTGSDATFANALAIATGGTPPGPANAATSTVSAPPSSRPPTTAPTGKTTANPCGSSARAWAMAWSTCWLLDGPGQPWNTQSSFTSFHPPMDFPRGNHGGTGASVSV